MNNKDFILDIYKDKRTVFGLSDIAMLCGEANAKLLSWKLRYYVNSGRLISPRRGIYAKPSYNPEELACTLYTPSYISLEYVLQKSGIVFQYDSRITMVGTLSREVTIDNECDIVYRKVKGEILIDTLGIVQNGNTNIATAERAFLDILYLDKDYYFDNLYPLDKGFVYKILPIYKSKRLTNTVNKLLNNG